MAKNFNSLLVGILERLVRPFFSVLIVPSEIDWAISDHFMGEIMKNLKTVSDSDLLSQIRLLSAEERKLTLQVLELLREVERRRLYARQGYGSLFEYTVKELGYSEASAARRIHSMRLLKEIPEVAQKIEEGSLNLSTVSTVQCFLKREEKEQGKVYSAQEKRELLQKMENHSHRQCEQILLQASPESARPKERARVISPTETELRFIASEELIQKLEQLKGLLAHSHPSLGLSQLVELMADKALERLDPARKKGKVQNSKPELPVASVLEPAMESASTPTSNPTSNLPHRRFIHAALRREVWARDGGRCTYVSPQTGRRCGSQFGIEIDHVQPLAKNGTSELHSLRLLCREHNTWEAIRHFGHDKMEKYIPTLRAEPSATT